MNVTGERVINRDHETGKEKEKAKVEDERQKNLDEPSVKRQKTESSEADAARPRSPSAKDVHRGKQELASASASASVQQQPGSASSSSSSANSSSSMVREGSRRSGAGAPQEFHQGEPVEVFFRFSSLCKENRIKIRLLECSFCYHIYPEISLETTILEA